MDQLDGWVVKIAEVAEPGEVVVAPRIMQAYIAGGADRADLFLQNPKGTPGGFDVGIFLVVLPYLLKGLDVAAPYIVTILTSTLSGVAVEVVKQKLKEQKQASLKELADDPYEPLKRLNDILLLELRKARVPEDKAALITAHVILVALENPEGTQEYLKRLPKTVQSAQDGPIKRLFKKLFKKQ